MTRNKRSLVGVKILREDNIKRLERSINDIIKYNMESGYETEASDILDTEEVGRFMVTIRTLKINNV